MLTIDEVTMEIGRRNCELWKKEGHNMMAYGSIAYQNIAVQPKSTEGNMEKTLTGKVRVIVIAMK